MKVICIDGGRRAEDIGNEPLLSEGTVYTVEQEVYGNTSKGTIVDCYKLTSINLPYVYVKDRFILCSDGPDGAEEEEQVAEEELVVKKKEKGKVKSVISI
jgi:hypothetical protein